MKRSTVHVAGVAALIVTSLSMGLLGCSDSAYINRKPTAIDRKPTAAAPAHEYHADGEVAPAQLADASLSTLVPGRIVYNPPSTMRVGDSTPIQVRVASAATPTSALTNGLIRGLSTPPEGIRISRTMKVSLTAAPDDFKIDLQSPEEQMVEDGSPTEWLWIVKPLRSGKRNLYLSAIAVVAVGGVEKVKEFPVHTDQIEVTVNPVGFVENHWKELSGAITGTGLLGWIGARFQSRKRKNQHKSAHR
jgi:hypothetical protein